MLTGFRCNFSGLSIRGGGSLLICDNFQIFPRFVKVCARPLVDSADSTPYSVNFATPDGMLRRGSALESVETDLYNIEPFAEPH